MNITDLISTICQYRSENYCDPRVLIRNQEEYDNVFALIREVCSFDTEVVVLTFKADAKDIKFPLALKLSTKSDYVQNRSYSKQSIKDCPWSVKESLRASTSIEYQQYHYGINVEIEKDPLTPQLLLDLFNKSVSSDVAKYMEGLRT